MFDLPLLLFVEDRVRAGARREDVIRDLEQAALRAARATLGDALAFEASFDSERDHIAVYVVCRVVETVRNPARELTPAMAHAANLHGEVGDELLFEVAYRWSGWAPSCLDAMPTLAPRFSVALGEAMLVALLGVFERHGYHRSVTFPPGTVGDALANTGGWLRGFTENDVTIERTFLVVHLEFLAAATFDVYWAAHVRHRGRVQVVWADLRVDANVLLAPFIDRPPLRFATAFREVRPLLGGVTPGVELPPSSDAWIAAVAAGPPATPIRSLHFQTVGS